MNDKPMFGAFQNIDELLECAAPEFLHSVGILLTHVNGEGNQILAGLQDAGNAIVQKAPDVHGKDVRLFGAYGQYCTLTHDALTIELHRMIEDRHDLLVTIGPVLTEKVQQIIAEQTPQHVPRLISIGAFTSAPLSFELAGFHAQAFAQQLKLAHPNISRPFMPHHTLNRLHGWQREIYAPSLEALEAVGIAPRAAAVSSYKEIAQNLPETADAVIILPHDTLIDYHLQLATVCQERGIPLIVCAHHTTKTGSSSFAYAPDMRTYGRDAGSYLATLLKNESDTAGGVSEQRYFTSS